MSDLLCINGNISKEPAIRADISDPNASELNKENVSNDKNDSTNTTIVEKIKSIIKRSIAFSRNHPFISGFSVLIFCGILCLSLYGIYLKKNKDSNQKQPVIVNTNWNDIISADSRIISHELITLFESKAHTQEDIIQLFEYILSNPSFSHKTLTDLLEFFVENANKLDTLDKCRPFEMFFEQKLAKKVDASLHRISIDPSTPQSVVDLLKTYFIKHKDKFPLFFEKAILLLVGHADPSISASNASDEYAEAIFNDDLPLKLINKAIVQAKISVQLNISLLQLASKVLCDNYDLLIAESLVRVDKFPQALKTLPIEFFVAFAKLVTFDQISTLLTNHICPFDLPLCKKIFLLYARTTSFQSSDHNASPKPPSLPKIQQVEKFFFADAESGSRDICTKLGHNEENTSLFLQTFRVTLVSPHLINSCFIGVDSVIVQDIANNVVEQYLSNDNLLAAFVAVLGGKKLLQVQYFKDIPSISTLYPATSGSIVKCLVENKNLDGTIRGFLVGINDEAFLKDLLSRLIDTNRLVMERDFENVKFEDLPFLKNELIRTISTSPQNINKAFLTSTDPQFLVDLFEKCTQVRGQNLKTCIPNISFGQNIQPHLIPLKKAIISHLKQHPQFIQENFEYLEKIELTHDLMNNEAFDDAENDQNFPSPQELDEFVRASDNLIGLKNLGNKCYIGCSTQVILHTTSIVDVLLNMKIELDSAKSPILYQLRCLAFKTWSSNKQLLHSVLIPTKFIDLMKASFDILCNNEQEQDATEFLIQLFDAIEREFVLLKLEQYNELLFVGSLEETHTCEHCMYQSVKSVVFSSLILSLVDGKTTLNELMDAYLNSESVENFQCGYCQKKGDAKTSRIITKTPRNLMITLQRTSFHQQRINVNIEFDLVYQFFQDTYKLYAVIHQEIGERNHYLAYILDSKDKWRRFNDAVVSDPVEKEDIFGENAYALFYTKI